MVGIAFQPLVLMVAGLDLIINACCSSANIYRSQVKIGIISFMLNLELMTLYQQMLQLYIL